MPRRSVQRGRGSRARCALKGDEHVRTEDVFRLRDPEAVAGEECGQAREGVTRDVLVCIATRCDDPVEPFEQTQRRLQQQLRVITV